MAHPDHPFQKFQPVYQFQQFRLADLDPDHPGHFLDSLRSSLQICLCFQETVENDSLTGDKAALLYSLHTHFVLVTTSATTTTSSIQPFQSSSPNLYDSHLRSLSVDYVKLLLIVCQDLFEHCRLVSKFGRQWNLPRLPSLFTPAAPHSEAATVLHLLHFTLVALFDSSVLYMDEVLVQLSDLHTSTIAFLQTVLQSLFGDGSGLANSLNHPVSFFARKI